MGKWSLCSLGVVNLQSNEARLKIRPVPPTSYAVHHTEGGGVRGLGRGWGQQSIFSWYTNSFYFPMIRISRRLPSLRPAYILRPSFLEPPPAGNLPSLASFSSDAGELRRFENRVAIPRGAEPFACRPGRCRRSACRTSET